MLGVKTVTIALQREPFGPSSLTETGRFTRLPGDLFLKPKISAPHLARFSRDVGYHNANPLTLKTQTTLDSDYYRCCTAHPRYTLPSTRQPSWK